MLMYIPQLKEFQQIKLLIQFQELMNSRQTEMTSSSDCQRPL